MTIRTILGAAALALSAGPLLAQTVYFEDGFDGDELSADWELLNPDPDAYLVEAGQLILLTADGVPAAYDAATNVLRLTRPVPKGDWTMTARFNMAPQTMGEALRIGVARDGQNGLFSSFVLEAYNYALTNIRVDADKLAKGEVTAFRRAAMGIEERDIELRSGQFSDRVAAVELRLEKVGRKYQSSIRFEPVNPGADDAPSGEWIGVQKLTSLRSPGDAFVLIFGSASNGYTPDGGEALVEVDFVRIDVAE